MVRKKLKIKVTNVLIYLSCLNIYLDRRMLLENSKLSLLSQDFREKIFTDFNLILVDPEKEINLNLHKLVLYYTCPYFEKMFSDDPCRSAEIINTSNASIMNDVILSLYGIGKKSTPHPKWLYKLETIKCRHYLGLEINVCDLYGIEVSPEKFNLLLEVANLFGYDDYKLVRTIMKNLPGEYDIYQLPKELLQQWQKNRQLIAIVDGRTIKIFTAHSGELITQFECDESIEGNSDITIGNITFSNNARYLIFSLETHRWTHHPRKATHCKHYYTSQIKIWDMIKEKYLESLYTGNGSILSLNFPPDDSFIICSDSNGMIRYWDTTNGNSIELGERKKGMDVPHALFTVDNKFIISNHYIYRNGGPIHIKIWDVKTNQCVKIINHEIIGRELKISNNGKYFVSREIGYCSPNETNRISLWCVATHDQIYSAEMVECACSNPLYPTNMGFTDNNTSVLLAYANGLIKLMDLESGKFLKCFATGINNIKTIELFDSDKKVAITSRSDEAITKINTFDLESGQCTWKMSFTDNIKFMKIIDNSRKLLLETSRSDFYGERNKIWMIDLDLNETINLYKDVDRFLCIDVSK